MSSGGGGGSNQPTQVQQTTSNVPTYLQPYAEQLAGQGMAYTQKMVDNGMPSYIGDPSKGGGGVGGTNIAGLTDLQNKSINGWQNMLPTAQTGQATDSVNYALRQAQNSSAYNPMQATNQYNAPTAGSIGIGYQNTYAPALQDYQMQGPDSYTGANVQQYMSPYQQGVTQQLQNQAIQSYANSLPQLGSAATQVGGLGGSRSALMAAQAQQGLQQNLANIQATGQQNAYQNAQQQFNTQQQMQQGANSQNLQARLGIQQLGAGQNMQSQLANQQAGLSAQNMALQQQQGLNQYGLTNAANNAQFGQAAQQANIGQQQFGANYGLQNIASQLAASGQLGNLGQQLFGQQTGILQGQGAAGAQQQGNQQQVNNALLQNFQAGLNWTPAQLQFASSLLRGNSPATLGQNTSVATYQQSPNMMGQIAGTAAGMAGMYGMMGGG